MKISLQIVSDLHLEFLPPFSVYDLPRKAPYLCLLGDIGRPHSFAYKDFLERMSLKFDRVLVVAGNHEYYNSRSKKEHWTMQELNAQIGKVCSQFSNVIFLDNKVCILEGFRIVGTTLWSFIPSDMEKYAKERMNDYRCIYLNDKRLIEPLDVSILHQECRSFLEREIESSREPTIVLSHHAPLLEGTSDPKYDDDPLKCVFATDLPSLLCPPLELWAFGHTHHPCDFTFNNVRILSNPQGYPQESIAFQRDKVVTIEKE